MYSGGGGDRGSINSFAREPGAANPFDLSHVHYIGLGRLVLPIALKPELLSQPPSATTSQN
jgi:hypothetical protein